MFEAIEKLRDIKANLLYERNEIDTEVEKIDVAIEKFEEGINVLGQEIINKEKAEVKAIEAVLQESHFPMHHREIIRRLQQRGFAVTEEELLKILLNHAKDNKKFKEVSPSIFTTIDKPSVASGGVI